MFCFVYVTMYSILLLQNPLREFLQVDIQPALYPTLFVHYGRHHSDGTEEHLDNKVPGEQYIGSLVHTFLILINTDKLPSSKAMPINTPLRKFERVCLT